MARSTVKAAGTSAVVIKRSRIAGRGGFAARDIVKGERLIEYVGERVSHAVADSRYDDASMRRHHTFLFTVNRRVVIDGAVRGNESRFLNHACDPNCEAVIEQARVFIDAKRDIRAGEELCYDYAFERDGSETADDEFRLYGCKCGSAKCRGTILAPRTTAKTTAKTTRKTTRKSKRNTSRKTKTRSTPPTTT